MNMEEDGNPSAGKDVLAARRQSRDVVSCFSNGLRVIRAFSDEAPKQTLSDVAERTGLTRASARRLLLTLVNQGFAARIEGGRYFVLTPKILLLGNAYLSSTPMWRFAEPVLEQLVRAVGETSSLSVLDGHESVYVLRIPVRRILDRVSTVGSRLPAYCTSMGRMLLSMQPQAVIERYLAEARLTPFNEKTLVDPALLRESLVQIRREGYAWVADEVAENIKGLAVPVFDAHGNGIAALAISINQSRLDDTAFVRKVLPELKRASMRLSASMSVAQGQRAGR